MNEDKFYYDNFTGTYFLHDDKGENLLSLQSKRQSTKVFYLMVSMRMLVRNGQIWNK